MKCFKIVLCFFFIQFHLYGQSIVINGYENIEREGLINDFNFINDKIKISYLNDDGKSSSVMISNLKKENFKNILNKLKRITFSGGSFISGNEGLITIYDSLDDIVMIIGSNIRIPFEISDVFLIGLDSEHAILKVKENNYYLKVQEEKIIEIYGYKYKIILKDLRYPKPVNDVFPNENLNTRCDIIAIRIYDHK